MVNKTLTNKNDTYVGSNNDDVIQGLDGNDSIFGANGDDQIYGGDGDDILRAGTGDDRLFGGDGLDFLTVYTGNEYFDGGKGIDFIDFGLAEKGVTVDLAQNSAKFVVESKTYTVKYTAMEAVYGSSHGDKQTGDNQQNILRGQDGNDQLSGRGGDDFLLGGYGKDVLTGGAGKDVFVFGEAPFPIAFDKVNDFVEDVDQVALYDGIFDLDGTGKTYHFTDYRYQVLDADQFQSGKGHAAANADIRVIYDSKDGILYYDDNGSKSGGLAKIADLGEGLNLTAASFAVYDY